MSEKLSQIPETHKRRFPSTREVRAETIGPLELMNLVEWVYRARPRALRIVRQQYRAFCLYLLKKIERA
jgi:hypothetical protein